MSYIVDRREEHQDKSPTSRTGSFATNLIQNASDTGQGWLLSFPLDLLFLDDEDLRDLPLVDREIRLGAFLVGPPDALR